MTRLIDKEDVLREISSSDDVFITEAEQEYLWERIQMLPTVDAVPIEWLRKHMITPDEVRNGEYYEDEALELNLYISDLIEKWYVEQIDHLKKHKRRKEE